MIDSDERALAPLEPLDNWRHAVSTGPAWIHRFLVAREACDNDTEAVRRARVSVAIVQRELRRNPVFAELHQRAIERTLTLGTEDAKQLAREASAGIVQDALEASRNSQHERDRVSNRRLLLESAGLTGGNARQADNNITIIANQLAVIVSQLPSPANDESEDAD